MACTTRIATCRLASREFRPEPSREQETEHIRSLNNAQVFLPLNGIATCSLALFAPTEFCSYLSRKHDVGGHVFRSDKVLTSTRTLKTLHLTRHVAVKHYNVIYVEMMVI
jgi:hypothetical protein